MTIYSTIYLVVSILVIIFLAWRCIVLTKALATYQAIILELVNDKLTRDNLKIIACAMYGMSTDEFERRMKK